MQFQVVTLPVTVSEIVVICNLAEFAARPSEMTARIPYTVHNFRIYVYLYVYEYIASIKREFSQRRVYVEINLHAGKANVTVINKKERERKRKNAIKNDSLSFWNSDYAFCTFSKSNAFFKFPKKNARERRAKEKFSRNEGEQTEQRPV